MTHRSTNVAALMGGAPAVGNDAYTVVLLHFDGADTGTTFTDSNAGGAAKTWTAAGDAQLDTAEKKFGSASGLFDGTGDYISTPDHADFTFGGGDYTVDLWFNRAGGDGTTRVMLSNRNSTDFQSPMTIFLTSANKVQAQSYFAGAFKNLISTTTFTATGWHHVAMVRDGTTMRLFIDGTEEATAAVSGDAIDSAIPLYIGRMGETDGSYWNGWIDEVRISKGIARWTANFTPPTAAYG